MMQISRRFVILLFAICLPWEASAAKRPNILLIVSEDNGPELSCYGDPSARTPHLDHLASEGIRFTQAYVPQAGCSQSRASFFTGLYPHQHGQIGLATWGFRLYRKDTPNMPRRLKTAGYRTGIIGKLHINPASAFPFDYQEMTGANFQRNDLAEYAKHAEAFIAAGESPFFLSVNYPEAHDPWIRQVDGLPKDPQTQDDVQIMEYMGLDSPALRNLVADYYNCMSRLDSLVGDLLQVLLRSGHADNTIVIYIGDHGADMLRAKRTCYEGGLRIPMLMRWPGHIAPQIRSELVSTLDLMPTLLKAAGATAVKDLPGSALQPLFQPGNPEWRTHLFAEYHTHAAAPNYFPQRCIRGPRYKLIESLLPDTIHPDYAKTIAKLHGDYTGQSYAERLNLNAVISQSRPAVKAAYQLMRTPPRFQLYDLENDPHEFHNLANDLSHANILKDLQERLALWRTSSYDPLTDPKKLRQLTAEIRSIKKKSTAKKHAWQYPQYLRD